MRYKFFEVLKYCYCLFVYRGSKDEVQILRSTLLLPVYRHCTRALTSEIYVDICEICIDIY
jgi:hypothetical protein